MIKPRKFNSLKESLEHYAHKKNKDGHILWKKESPRNKTGIPQFGTTYLGKKGSRTSVTTTGIRAAWINAGRKLEKGQGLVHICNSIDCINPDHIAIRGTVKGTLMVGGPGQARRFTDDEIRTIRSSTKPTRQLANEYGVCWTTIRSIIIRKFYKSVK